jgi:hypothetical protein
MELPDWIGFDSGRHQYIAQTAGGDGWQVTPPIDEAIKDDIWRASDEATDDEGVTTILNTAVDEWLDSLEVYNGNTLVAHFNIEMWEWVEI